MFSAQPLMWQWQYLMLRLMLHPHKILEKTYIKQKMVCYITDHNNMGTCVQKLLDCCYIIQWRLLLFCKPAQWYKNENCSRMAVGIDANGRERERERKREFQWSENKTALPQSSHKSIQSQTCSLMLITNATFLLRRKLVVQSVFYKCSSEAPNKALILVCQRALLLAWQWIYPLPKCH